MSTSPMRSAARLSACEGSLLVVDASQGVEAQTLANVYQALDNDHEIVCVLNKIDLPAAEPDRIKEQIEEVIGLDASDAVPISAKTGLGIADVLEAIVTRLPPPKEGDPTKPLKALLVDSWYDAYLGVIVLVRVIDGVIRKGQTIRMMGTGAKYLVDRVGVFTPKMVPVEVARPRRDRLHHRLDQGSGRHPRRRHHHRGQAPDRQGAAGLQAGPAGGVLRPVPGRCGRFRGSARRHGQAAPQRRELLLRDGNLGRARLRLPLRLPRPAASRNHPGAAGARVRPRPHRHRAVGRLRDAHARGRDHRAAQSGRHAGSRADRGNPRAVDPRHHPDAGRISRRDPEALPGPARHAGRPLLCRQARHADLRPAAQRGGVRFLRPAEVDLEGLCLLRLQRSPT